ncbi:MAG: procyclic acidic repetitive family protein [Actinomycetota bacterium]|nr:procyclic acidic repetitive family protein [Actinomycetota bacterium]
MNVRWLSSTRALVAAFVAALLIVVLLAVLVIRQGAEASNSQVYLETAGGVGANPFVPLTPAAPKAVGGEVDPGGGVTPNAPGTDNVGTCDPGALAAYLGAHPDKASAWAQALNSDPTLTWSGGSQVGIQQIPAYIRELTPRVLTDDLRVTNYRFTGGSAAAVQAVLQDGTAVLVDAKGVSRVRCACGNPLTPMIRLSAQPIYLGRPWPGFQPLRITVIEQPPQPKPGPGPQPELQLEPGPKLKPKHAPESEPELRHESTPEPKPEPELRHESTPEPKPERKPKHEPKLESKPTPKPKQKSEPEQKSEPKQKSEPEQKSELET